MIVRVFIGEDGESRFEDVRPAYEPFMPFNERAPLEAAEGIHFARHLPGYFMDWHGAPRRQYVIFLSGRTEITVGDGTSLIFTAGDVLLADDVGGRHTVRVLGDEPRLSATVPLQD